LARIRSIGSSAAGRWLAPLSDLANGLADWQALAGLDMALFDWAGRRCNMPIWQLLGGFW